MHKLRPALLVALLKMAVLVLFLMRAAPMTAQESTPRVELAGVYSYTGSITGVYIGIPLGFGTDVNVNVTRWLGAEGDFQYSHKNLSLVGVRGLTLLGGPRFTVRRRRADVFFHGLIGFTNESVSFVGLSAGANVLTFGGGGSVNVTVHKHLAIRVVEADFLSAHEVGSFFNFFRVTSGLVFTFGQHETIPRAETAPQSYPAPVRQTYPGGTTASDAPLLGVSGYPNGNGFNVTAIVPGSPADTQVHMEVRDIIVSIDGQPVHTAQDIEQAIAKSQTGTVRITYLIKGSFGNARDVKVR